MAVKRITLSFRLLAALALLLSGLALVAAATPAAAAATAPGRTIAAAGTLGTSDSASGGGSAIDFWKVRLNGGDVLQVSATFPAQYYTYALYAPGTTDANFATALSFSTDTPYWNAGKAVFDLQAPYNGTFILAVCENVNNNYCGNVDQGNGTNPMNPYTFTTTLVKGGISAATAARETKASPSIGGAAALRIGNLEAGGANPVDYWKIKLNGGDVVQFSATFPAQYYTYALYAPGTSDANFATALSFSTDTPYWNAGKSVFDLQAPYNGTFILAVCENVNNNYCGNVDQGNGTNPMTPYVFTTTLVKGAPSAATAARETKASPSIAGARPLGLGSFEAGGANPIDFWKVRLNGGDVVQFSATFPAQYYTYALYAPGTSDANFTRAVTFSTDTPYWNAGKAVFDLQAPHNGTFILAVCENVNNNNCANVDQGNGTNPMNPYVFTTRLAGGRETRTSLRLAARSVRYGHEKGFRFTVGVASLFGRARPGGKAVVYASRKALCTARIVNGAGWCALATSTRLPVGSYPIAAAYAGNRDPSTSPRYTLKITR